MEYVIGIDGGGTKTHLVAVDRQMNVLFQTFGGSSNLASLSEKAVQQNLWDLLDCFFLESGLPPEDCRCVCLGSAGAGRESARVRLAEMLRQRCGGAEVFVMGDAEGALAGGSGDGTGILLIAGTGAICFGKNACGETWRTGGWGHIAGDEGSGYDMACQLLRAVTRAADGRGEPTLLTELVMDHWSLDGMDGLVDAVYRSGKGKSDIAALAFLCDIAYDKGDKTAFQIMENCAAALAELAVTAAGRLFEPEEQVPCLCAGSLLEKSPYLKRHLQGCLAGKQPLLELQGCKHDAAWGCASIAWKKSVGY